MHASEFTLEDRTAWDAFAAASPDAWFWHTTDWMDFILEMGHDRAIQNLSFSLSEGPERLAVCPVFVETVAGRRQLSHSGEFLTTPAMSATLSESRRQAVTEAWVARLDQLAADHDAVYTRIMTPALAPARMAPQLATVDPLLRLGFFDLPAATQVIDLAQTEEALWSAVRKGHKSDVKRGDAACEFSAWDSTTITQSKFREYQELHRKDAGRVTRSQRSFDIMHDWIVRDRAVLAESTYARAPASFALIMLFGAGAYYGSGCKDPELMKIPSSHALQWRTMLWLRQRGVRYYDIGSQFLGDQWHQVVSAKHLSIAAFKRGFGGRTMRVAMSERYYSADVRSERMRERLAQLTAPVVCPEP